MGPEKSHLIELNFYEGNRYWICAAVGEGPQSFTLELFDAGGRSIDGDKFREDSAAGLGLIAPYTGTYYLRVAAGGGTAGAACVLYGYK